MRAKMHSVKHLLYLSKDSTNILVVDLCFWRMHAENNSYNAFSGLHIVIYMTKMLVCFPLYLLSPLETGHVLLRQGTLIMLTHKFGLINK
jgi:hypothetical protein